ncbi:MAG: hypothetical protein KF889_29840 [Alphaproteobacteria bacterium]|nr:hypothetical protein [Alphaproteobacteria bacterium]MCW5743348.1 hypothetical protein [Alphaproteobacteria bacterium]
MARRAPAGRKLARDATYAHVVTLPMQPPGCVAEIDAEARRIAAGRCGRWTSSGRLHVGFAEAAHRDAFVLWLAVAGIETG